MKRTRSRQAPVAHRGPLAVSVVDTRTGALHRVAVDIAALHRPAGRYPALCGAEVPAASLTTPATTACRRCAELMSPPGAPPGGASWLRRLLPAGVRR